MRLPESIWTTGEFRCSNTPANQQPPQKKHRPKIAIIGAGSLVFCKTLMDDFLATPALAGSEYSLMALSHTRLDKMHAFVDRMIKDNGVDATVTKTTDRREALRDADYVVAMIQVGGVDAFKVD